VEWNESTVRTPVDMTLNRRVRLASGSGHLISNIMTSYIISTTDGVHTVAYHNGTPNGQNVIARNGN